MDVLKRICALFAAFASMLSGGFWYSSAQAQHNLWAAELAAVAGIFLAIALLLE
jgi:hypothetical protein